MDVLELGNGLLWVASVLTGTIFLIALCGILFKERRLVVAARSGMYALLVLVGGSAACLVYGFLAGEYNNEYIYNYSEKHLPAFFKFAGLWAGLDGSLLFWTLLLTAYSAAAAFQHRWSSRHPTGRRLEPYVYLVLTSIIGFFLAVCLKEKVFAGMPLDERLRLAAGHKVPIDEAGNLLDGHGLNPQLVNYWFVIHPPNLYLGFIGFSIPFAFTLAALFAGEVGDYWVRIVRRWTMVAWVFLTNGIILGGLWAYRQLGWGGYWAWDPVENASFLPWLTGTAFLHSIMIQERRDMLKGWNVFLIVLTFFLTITGTWMTRSGVVNSVHAFAGGDIGIWFQVFMFIVAGVGAFAIAFRRRELAGTHAIESLLSREVAFYLNNLVLLVIAAAVFFLSFMDKISHDWFAREMTQKGLFQIVTTPFFALLLLLTAVGPGLGWVKTSLSSLRRNFLKSAVVTLVLTSAVYALLHWRGLLGTWQEVLLPRFFHLQDAGWRDLLQLIQWQHPAALYPTGVFIGLAIFIFATVFSELFRSLKARVKLRKEAVGAAFLNIVLRNNRRWGGYTVHLGIAILAVGIISSSMFQVKKEAIVRVGQSIEVGPYKVTLVEASLRQKPMPGEPYWKEEKVFRVTWNPPPALPVAHGDTAGAEGTPSNESGPTPEVLVTELRPEGRFYPKIDQWLNEVSIHRMLLGDIYIAAKRATMASGDIQDIFSLTVFLNPLMMLIYLGWFTMIAGAIFAALPMPGSRVGLSE